eukprot:gene3950-2813_t
MGYAPQLDIWVQPFIDNADIFFPMVLWWILFHIAMNYLVPRVMPHFDRIKDKGVQEDLIIRCVSAANGMMMSTCMPVFVKYVLQNGLLPWGDLYVEIPEYRFYRVAVCAYFTWDVIVCFYYRWSTAWKIHAICSFLGTFLLLYPMMDNLASYFSGWFEGTNAFMHFSIMLRALSAVCDASKPQEKALKARMDGIATVLEYCFGVLYFLIRVCGGSYITLCCDYRFVTMLMHDVPLMWAGDTTTKRVSHSELVLLLAATSVTAIQLLQYVWFVAIVKKALGYDVDDGAKSSAPVSATAEKKKED